MPDVDTLRALIEEILAEPPWDEIWCAFCGEANWKPHTEDCWVTRATAALA